MEIRCYREADRQAVIELWNSIFGYEAPHNEPSKVIDNKIAVDRDLFFVAQRDGNLVGTVMGGYDGHRGWIYSLCVDPNHRRRGIAASLVAHVENALATAGCLKVNLQIHAANREVVSFYESAGYKCEERISMGKRLFEK